MRIEFALMFVAILLSIPTRSQVDKWAPMEPIVPLHSTRADVESILGRASEECNCLYETSKERVRVEYAAGACEGGWNIPIDTVIEFVVEPKVKPSLKSLGHDLASFVKMTDDALFSTYFDVNKGVTINVSPYGEVERMKFGPLAINGDDRKLRCSDAPTYAPFNDLYLPAVSFRILGWRSDLPKFNELLERFSTASHHKLYIIVYFPRDGQKGLKPAQYIRRVSSHTKKLLPTKAASINIIVGGNRSKAEVEAFILRSDLPTPVPAPSKIS